MSKSILTLLTDELIKVQAEIQDAEKREADIIKAIKAIESDKKEDIIKQEEEKDVIEQGDTVKVIDIDLTESRYSYTHEMHGVGHMFTVREVCQDSKGSLYAYDDEYYMYALEDLKLIEKKS